MLDLLLNQVLRRKPLSFLIAVLAIPFSFAHAENEVVQSVQPSRWSVFGQGGYSSFATNLGSVSGNGVGLGVQYQAFGKGQIGVNWVQTLAGGASLNALYNGWTIEGGWRILGGDRTELRTIEVNDHETVQSVNRTARSALSIVGHLRQLSLSTSTGGSFSGYGGGLLYEYGILRTAWIGALVEYTTLSSSSQKAHQTEFLIRLRFPLQLKF